jgi:hypothetical protein
VKFQVVLVSFARCSWLEFVAGYRRLDRSAPGWSFGFRQDFLVASMALTRDFCW